MVIKKRSYFKDPAQDLLWLENWVSNLETNNNRKYERIQIQTSLGKTHVWGLNTADESLETLVILPGFRTTSLFWDLDRGLDNLGIQLRIFLVETNGQPNLSDGNTPNIKEQGYGEWASEILDQLNITKTYIAGASFGGLVCMKLSIVASEKIKAAFILNPACLQTFSFGLKNLYYNLLPIFSPGSKNVSKFLDKLVFYKPNHQLSALSEKMVIDYELFAMTRYKDNTQKPYYMNAELEKVNVDTYLFEGDKDLLFPFKLSIKNAKQKIKTLKDITVFENVGHGIETYGKAMHQIGAIINKSTC